MSVLSTPIVLAAAEAGGLASAVAGGLVFWTIVTFLVVAAFLRWKVWGPLLAMLSEREKSIQDAIDAARREREQAERLLEEQKAAAAEARREAAEMVRRSQAEVEAAKTELFAKARTEADALLAQARKQIEEERRRAIADIRAVAVDLSIRTAERLVARELDDAAHRKLAEDFVTSLERDASSLARGAA